MVGRYKKRVKIPQGGLTPTTPVTSIAISPVKMSIGRNSLTNLRSEMFFSSRKTRFLYLPTMKNGSNVIICLYITCISEY
jgi:hypothetical protein